MFAMVVSPARCAWSVPNYRFSLSCTSSMYRKNHAHNKRKPAVSSPPAVLGTAFRKHAAQSCGVNLDTAALLQGS